LVPKRSVSFDSNSGSNSDTVRSPAGASRYHRSMSSPTRRFASPWSIEEHNDACFIVSDANSQKIAYFYFADQPQRRSTMNALSRDEAFLLAVNFAKLPMVPRKILQDIPRPKASASED
jgi:hypothetical protein